MTTKRITKRDAERCLARVRRTFRITPQDVKDGRGPVLRKDWNWVGHTDWAIIWEEGPYEWTYTLCGWNDDLFPTSVFVEPITSWAVGLYPSGA